MEGKAQEVWYRATPTTLAGAFTFSRDGVVVFHEILTLIERDGSLGYSVKHFNADLTGWEAQGEAVRFKLARRDADALFFDGLTYRRAGPDRVLVYVAVSGEDGDVEEYPFTMDRAR